MLPKETKSPSVCENHYESVLIRSFFFSAIPFLDGTEALTFVYIQLDQVIYTRLYYEISMSGWTLASWDILSSKIASQYLPVW